MSTGKKEKHQRHRSPEALVDCLLMKRVQITVSDKDRDLGLDTVTGHEYNLIFIFS
jgi:hypothetical protein